MVSLRQRKRTSLVCALRKLPASSSKIVSCRTETCWAKKGRALSTRWRFSTGDGSQLRRWPLVSLRAHSSQRFGIQKSASNLANRSREFQAIQFKLADNGDPDRRAQTVDVSRCMDEGSGEEDDQRIVDGQTICLRNQRCKFAKKRFRFTADTATPRTIRRRNTGETPSSARSVRALRRFNGSSSRAKCCGSCNSISINSVPSDGDQSQITRIDRSEVVTENDLCNA